MELLKKLYPFQRNTKPSYENECQSYTGKLHALCNTVKAEDLQDLQHIFCSMVLSECVYKIDRREMVEALNAFKLDFGGELVNINQVQPCLDHVPHRYLLAVSGDTLYAAFIGTKQYRDYITNMKILQEAVFQEEIGENTIPNYRKIAVTENNAFRSVEPSYNDKKSKAAYDRPHLQTKVQENGYKPAAHQGFVSRAKLIPAMELYRLAWKHNQKLILCGHSLGGAIAVLITLTILRNMSSYALEREARIFIRCITFSQPPVGNTALRDFVHGHGWQWHFRTFCIPDDVVPRLLSPHYFQHYHEQLSGGNLPSSVFDSYPPSVVQGFSEDRSTSQKPFPTEQDRKMMGSSLQKYFYRLSRLVPILSLQKQLDESRSNMKEKNLKDSPKEVSSEQNIAKIQDRIDGRALSVKSSSEPSRHSSMIIVNPKTDIRTLSGENNEHVQSLKTSRFPVYVPFGKLLLLGELSVEPLSASDFSYVSSVRTFFSEFKERFPLHSMKSYRTRFYRMYVHCTKNQDSFSISQLPQKELQSVLLNEKTESDSIKVGGIMESHTIQAATSIVPLAQNEAQTGKHFSENMKVDIFGYGLHMCTLIQAEVNGHWCPATVDPVPLPHFPSQLLHSNLQHKRIQIRTNFKRTHRGTLNRTVDYQDTSANVGETSYGISRRDSASSLQHDTSNEPIGFHSAALRDVCIQCSSDFITTTKKVYLRTRRVRLLGLEGSGKTSLYNALLGLSIASIADAETIIPEAKYQEGFARGISIVDAAGVNLQDLHGEVAHFRKEITIKPGQINKKIDLVILVHNISHKIPFFHNPDSSSSPCTALSLLLNEVDAAGIPWILAITNKFSVSAHRLKAAINEVVEAYHVPSNMYVVLNSCDYVAHGTGIDPPTWNSGAAASKDTNGSNRFQGTVQKIISGFRKRAVILPIEGVDGLWSLMHDILTSKEEYAFQELATEVLSIEAAQEQHNPVLKDFSVKLASLATSGFRMSTSVMKRVLSAFKGP